MVNKGFNIMVNSIHENRLTSSLFSDVFIFPPEVSKFYKEKQIQSVAVVISPKNNSYNEVNFDLKISGDLPQLQIKSDLLLKCGYEFGDKIKFCIQDKLISVSLLDRELAEEFSIAERNEKQSKIPPAWLISAFTGIPSTVDFLIGGAVAATRYIELYNEFCGSFENVRAIMDFGCGCGRVLRNMPTQVQLYGVDLHKDAISWINMSMPYVSSMLGSAEPPLRECVENIDFLYAISVLTHLNQIHESKWLKEWSKIVKQDGHLFLTFRGEDWVEDYAPESQKSLIHAEWQRNNGFCYQKHEFWKGIFPEYYCGTYHTHEYVKTVWGEYYEVLHIVASKDSPNRQNIAILKNNRGS